MWKLADPIWLAAWEEGWLAYCAGSVPVGAVITNAAGKIVAAGRNHISDNSVPPHQISENPLAHAEMNTLLSLFAGRQEDSHVCTLYTTVEPCPLCMGAIYMSGVRRICFASRDSYAGSTELLGKTVYLSRKRFHLTPPQDAVFESLILALNVESMLARAVSNSDPVLESWKTVSPTGVEFGRRLHESGWLKERAQSGAGAQPALEALYSLYRHEDLWK